MSSSTRTLSAPSLKNILFATDFSPCSQVVLPFLHDLAMRYGSAVHLVHVIASEARTAVPMDRVPELDVDQSDAESRAESHAGQRFSHRHSTHRNGRARRSLGSSRLAGGGEEDRSHRGRHARTSRAEEAGAGLDRGADLPPGAVPGAHHWPSQHQPRHGAGRLAPVLFATDFASGSQHALPYAVSLARTNHTSLILLHAVSPMLGVMPGGVDTMAVNVDCGAELVANAMADARRQMEELISAEAMQELKPEIVIDCGEASALILNTAESRGAGLIVMGAHRAGMHSVAAHLPGATASCVVCEAHCPVLTVRS